MQKVLISIPVLNEENTIGSIINEIKKIQYPNIVFTVIVIDDGSTDNSAEIAREHGAIVVQHPINKGLGLAFRTAAKYAVDNFYDIMVTIDGDGQFNPNDIVKLIDPIINNESDFVTASRFRNKDYVPNMPKIKLWGNNKVAKLVNRIAKLNLHDVSCGFRAYSFSSLLNLDLIGDYTYTHEVILVLAFRGFRLKEIDVLVEGERQFGKSKVASSIIKYAFNSSMIILRYIRDYKPLKFFGITSFTFFLLGLFCLLYFSISSIILNQFYPKFVAFIGAFLIVWAGILFIVALVADMFTRFRLQIDEISKRIYNNRINKE